MFNISILLDRNNVITVCGEVLEGINPYKDGIIIKTDVEMKDLINNYKYVDCEVVELSKEEKETLFPPPKQQPTETELLQKQLLETQNMLLELQYKLTNKDLEIK